VEAVGGDGRGVDEAACARGGGRPERVQRAVHVDRPGGLTAAADDQEGEVDHHVGALERVDQGVLVTDVAAPVVQLGPAVLGRVERSSGDADNAGHPVVGLEQWHQAEPERPGRAGDGHGQPGGVGRVAAHGRAFTQHGRRQPRPVAR
jgi:hypothetical protein